MNSESDGVPGWLPSALHPSWEFLAAYPAALALTIALVGIGLGLVARLFLLHAVGRIVRPLPGELAEGMLKIVGNVGAFVIGYLALVAAIQVLGLPENVEQIVTRVLVTLLILRLMRSGMKAAHIGLQVLAAVRNRYPMFEERTLPLFDLLANVLVIGVAAYALLIVWDIDPTAWLASAGVLGIAIGFAARETLANLFAGFFIIADTPYKVGDYIVFDTGERGEVTKVGMRSTRILTRDDVEVIMPNSAMANSKVVNESGGRWERFRIRLKIGVAYGSDVDEVVKLLEQIAFDHDTVVQDPKPRVRMRGFGDSSLDFELLCWVKEPALRGLVSHQLYIKIYKKLNEAGIEIPFPQRDVWMRSADSAGESGERRDLEEGTRD